MILADENIPQVVIATLRESGFEVLSVFENYRGYQDIEIVKIAQEKQLIILTEDKDFADLVFAYNMHVFAVILLRYHYLDSNLITKILIDFLQKRYKNIGLTQESQFVVITKATIRIKQIDKL